MYNIGNITVNNFKFHFFSDYVAVYFFVDGYNFYKVFKFNHLRCYSIVKLSKGAIVYIYFVKLLCRYGLMKPCSRFKF